MEGRQAPSARQDHERVSRGGEASEPALQEIIMWQEGHVVHKEQSQKRHGGGNYLECTEDLGEFTLMVHVKERQEIKLGGHVDLSVHIPDSLEVRTGS